MKIQCPRCQTCYDLDESIIGEMVECAVCTLTFSVHSPPWQFRVTNFLRSLKKNYKAHAIGGIVCCVFFMYLALAYASPSGKNDLFVICLICAFSGITFGIISCVSLEKQARKAKKTQQTAVLDSAESAKAKTQKSCLGCAAVFVGALTLFMLFPKTCATSKSDTSVQIVDKTSSKSDRSPSIFSAWDGSCRPLVEYVKDKVRDPDSFEHINTEYIESREYPVSYLVTMRFKSKNSFGGYKVGYITAEVTSGGRITSVVNYLEE